MNRSIFDSILKFSYELNKPFLCALGFESAVGERRMIWLCKPSRAPFSGTQSAWCVYACVAGYGAPQVQWPPGTSEEEALPVWATPMQILRYMGKVDRISPPSHFSIDPTYLQDDSTDQSFLFVCLFFT